MRPMIGPTLTSEDIIALKKTIAAFEKLRSGRGAVIHSAEVELPSDSIAGIVFQTSTDEYVVDLTKVGT